MDQMIRILIDCIQFVPDLNELDITTASSVVIKSLIYVFMHGTTAKEGNLTAYTTHFNYGYMT